MVKKSLKKFLKKIKKVLTQRLVLCIIAFVETTLAHRQAVRQRTLTPSSKVRILVGQLKNLEEKSSRFFVA